MSWKTGLAGLFLCALLQGNFVLFLPFDLPDCIRDLSL